MLGRASLLAKNAVPAVYSVWKPPVGLSGSFETPQMTMIHARWKMKKASGRCRQGGNVAGKRLGRKLSPGEFVKPGMNIYLQRGWKIIPGPGTAIARDQRIYSLQVGRVRYEKLKEQPKKGRLQISVDEIPEDHPKVIKHRAAMKALEKRREARRSGLEERLVRKRLVPEYAKQMTIHLKKIQAVLDSRRLGEKGITKTWIS